MRRAYAYNYREREMQTFIANNFDTLFPDYYYIQRERRCGNKGYADIFAGEKKSANARWLSEHNIYHGGRPVIIELKRLDIDPTPQLLRYAQHFDWTDPILIGISESPIKIDKMSNRVKYFILRGEYLHKYENEADIFMHTRIFPNC